MRTLISLFLFLSLLAAPKMAGAQAEDVLQSGRQGTFALINARVETVTSGAIERGTVVIQGDRIIAVGTDVAIPAGAEIIDATGLTLYPGMIDSGTRLGLSEVGSVSETNDYAEIGQISPQMQALTAVKPNSVLIPVTRVNGVTTVLTEPSGGLLPGTSALISLHGYTPEQMSVGNVRAVLLSFPQTGRRGSWDSRPDDEIEKATKEAMDQLNETWRRAVLFARIDSAHAAGAGEGRRPEYVPEMEALLPVVRGEMPLVINVNRASDIEKALDWVAEREIEKVIFSEVSEGWRVADRIAAAGIPCLVGPVLSLPTRGSDRFDKPYANAGLLHRAGVKVALRTGEIENVRNLPYHAAFAAAYGLGREEALRAVTVVPAEIFGVSDQIGSIEVGKKANLFSADGDPFETRTHIRHLFIDGNLVPLESRHTRLYEEFIERAR